MPQHEYFKTERLVMVPTLYRIDRKRFMVQDKQRRTLFYVMWVLVQCLIKKIARINKCFITGYMRNVQ